MKKLFFTILQALVLVSAAHASVTDAEFAVDLARRIDGVKSIAGQEGWVTTEIRSYKGTAVKVFSLPNLTKSIRDTINMVQGSIRQGNITHVVDVTSPESARLLADAIATVDKNPSMDYTTRQILGPQNLVISAQIAETDDNQICLFRSAWNGVGDEFSTPKEIRYVALAQSKIYADCVPKIK